MRVLVTGGRHFTDRALISKVLSEYLEQPDLVIVHGAARGADRIADHWAKSQGIQVEPHAARWDELGTKAGPIRNTKMVDLGADVCVAFPDLDSIGTWDCVEKAEAARIKTRVFDPRTGTELP